MQLSFIISYQTEQLFLLTLAFLGTIAGNFLGSKITNTAIDKISILFSEPAEETTAAPGIELKKTR